VKRGVEKNPKVVALGLNIPTEPSNKFEG